MKVYIAAPFERILEARKVSDQLSGQGVHIVSRWLQEDPSATLSTAIPADLITQNDDDVRGCDALLALAYHGQGGEMFAEIRFALDIGKPVVYCGERQVLSAFRPRVQRFQDVNLGIQRIIWMDAHWHGAR